MMIPGVTVARLSEHDIYHSYVIRLGQWNSAMTYFYW